MTESVSIPSRVKPVEPGATQRDVAYAELRRLILLQQVAGGAKLREPDWSERLGVNRMALREAFARLEAEGLIERGPKVGYVVPTLTDDDIREVLEARLCLESGAIDLVVHRDPMPALDPLAAAVEQLERLVDAGYLLGVTEADRRFHETLIELTGNPRLAGLYQRAPLPMIHDRLIGTDRWPAQCQKMLAEHRAILDALTRRDADTARTVLREHLDAKYLQPVIGR